jgi:hypothetical protein
MATNAYTRHRSLRKTASQKANEKTRDLEKILKIPGFKKPLTKTKPVSFKAVSIRTRGFKFNREEANA